MSQTGEEAFTLDELLDRIDLREIVKHRWGNGTQQGDVVRYRSQWERDSGDDAFVVYPDHYEDQSGTGETGNAVSWVKRELTLSLSEAQLWLQEWYDHTIAADLSRSRTNDENLDVTYDNPWWPGGVPDTWRTALLRFFLGSTALVVEIANAAFSQGLCDPSGFTRKELLTAAHSLGFAVGESTLADTMKRMNGIFFRNVTLYNNLTVNFQNNSIPRRGGRRPHVVRACGLMDIERHVISWARPRIYEECHSLRRPYAKLARFDMEVLQTLGFQNEIASNVSKQLNKLLKHFQSSRCKRNADERFFNFKQLLGDWASRALPNGMPIRSMSDYRAAVLRAWFNATEDPRIQNWELRVMLGCSRNTVRKTVERAGLKPVSQFTDVEISRSGEIEQQIRDYGRNLKGRPVFVVCSDDPADVLKYGIENSDRYIESRLASGLPVTIRFQTANLYRINVGTSVGNSTNLMKKREGEAGGNMQGRPRRAYGPQLDRNWVAGQLKLALDLLQYVRGSDFINPITGQIANAHASPIELLEILLGRPLN